MVDGDSEPKVWTLEKYETLTQNPYDSKAQSWTMEWYGVIRGSLDNIEPDDYRASRCAEARIEIQCLHCDIQRKKNF